VIEMKQERSAEVLQEAIDIGMTDVIVIGKINGKLTMLTLDDEQEFESLDDDKK